MAKYDGFIAKDKHGDFWYGTFGQTREDVESHIDNGAWKKEYKFKVVKVKIMEINDG